MKKFSSFLAVLILLCTFGARDSYSIDPPTTQAKYIGFSNVDDNSAEVSWINGTGNKRIVVISENPITATPTDNTVYNDVDGNFTDGSIQTIALGMYVIDVVSDPNYESDFTNLSEDTDYYVRVFEYNDNGTEQKYNTASGTANPTTFSTEKLVDTPILLTPSPILYYAATLRWQDVVGMPNTGDFANHYELSVKKASDDSPVITEMNVGANQDGTNPQLWEVINLDPATTYKFQVRAKINNVYGDWSNWLSFTTAAATTPAVDAITASDDYISADITGTFYIKVEFDQTMNTSSTVEPQIAFDAASSKFTEVYGQWSTTDYTNDTYTLYYDVDIDPGDYYPDIDVTVTDAENMAAMTMLSETEADLFTIDDLDPTVTLAITKNGDPATHIKDGDIVTVTATFNEDMDAAVPVQINVDFATDASGSNTTISLVRQSATEYKYIGDLAQEGTNTDLDGFIYLDDFTSGDDLAGNHTEDPTSGYTVYIDNTPPELDPGNDPDLSISNPATDAAGIELQSITSFEGSSYDTPDGQLDVVQIILVKDDGDGDIDGSAEYFNGTSFATGSFTAGVEPTATDSEWIDASNVGLWNYAMPITLPEGDYILYAKSVDLAGNTSIEDAAFAATATSLTERSRLFTIDRTDPASLVINNPADNSLTDDATTDLTASGFNGSVDEENTLESVEYVIYADDNENDVFDAGEAVYNPTTNAFAIASALSWNDVDNFTNNASPTDDDWDVDTEYPSITGAMDTYTGTSVKTFKFNVRATDVAGNISGTETHTVVVDREAPTGTLYFFADDGTSSGTWDSGDTEITEINDGSDILIILVTDEELNDTATEPTINDNSALGLFTGGDMDNNSTYNPAAYVSSGEYVYEYSYNVSSGGSDGTVDIQITAGSDLAGNNIGGSVPYQPTNYNGLIIDNTEPISYINTPVDGSTISSITKINGTIDEDNTIDKVEYRIQNSSGYWNGTDFSGSAAWFDVTTFNSTAGTFEITGSLITFISSNDGTYTVDVRTTDLAGNQESTPAQSVFTFDGAAPTITIGEPDVADKLYTSMPTFLGTADDGIEITNVQVAIKKLTNGFGDPVDLWYNDALGTFSSGTKYWNDYTNGGLPTTTLPFDWEYDDLNGNTDDGTYSIEARAFDGSSNIGYSSLGTFEIDGTAPEVSTITRTNPTPLANPHLTNSTSLEFTVTFNEDVTGFDVNDLTYTGSAGVDAADATITGSGDTYTVTIDMTGDSDGTVGLEIDPSGLGADEIEDGAGNDLGGSTITSQQYDVDRTDPIISSFVRANPSPTADPHLTNDNTLEFTFETSEDVQNVDVTDFEVKNDGTDAVATNGSVTNVSGSGDTYTITVTMTDDEIVYLEIASSNDIEDLYGNSLDFSVPGTPGSTNSTDETTGSYEYDGTAPSVSLLERETPSGTTDVTNDDYVEWEVTFTEDVVNFDATDITATTPTGLASGGVITVTPSGTSDSFIIRYTQNDDTEDGTVYITINTSDVEDEAGNGLSGSYNGIALTYEFDHTAPTIIDIQRLWDSETPDATTTVTTLVDTVAFLIEFSEEVGSVNTVDIAVNQLAPPTPSMITKVEVYATDANGVADFGTSSTKVYWKVLLLFTGDATAGITVDPFDSDVDITDVAGNDLAGSAKSSYNFKYDQTDPYLVTFIGHDPTISTDPQLTNQTVVTYRAQFNEPVTGVTTDDFDIYGTATGASITSATGVYNATNDYLWEIEVTYGGTDGEVWIGLNSATLPADDIEDGSNNDLTGGNKISQKYEFDLTPPEVQSITRLDDGGSSDDPYYTNNGTLRYEVTFTEDVTGFDVNDIDYSGTAGVAAGDATISTTTADYVYEVEIVMPAEGTVSIEIGPSTLATSDEIQDVATNDLGGSDVTSEEYYYDNTDPLNLTIDNITDGAYYNATSMPTDIQGTVDEAIQMGNVDFTLEIWNSGTSSWDNVATSSLSTTPLSGTGLAWAYTHSIATDGLYQVTVTATDKAGNGPITPVSKEFYYDATAPTVLSITTDTDPVYQGDLTQTVTVVYSESMDDATAPTITINGSSEFTAGTGTWSTTTDTDDTYTITFTHSSNEEEVTGLDAEITSGNAADLAGNAAPTGATSSPTFDVDTDYPAIDDVVVSVDPIYSGSLTQTVTVTYDEPMDMGVNPTVTLSGSNWGSASGATWNSSTEFEVSFTHDNTPEEITSTVTVAADAQDVAGNVDQTGDNSTTFEVDTEAPAVDDISVDTDPVYQGDLVQIVTITYDEPMDPATAPILTIDGNFGTANTTDTGLGWASSTEYKVQYTHNGSQEEITSASVEITGGDAADLAGNAAPTGDSETFEIDTDYPAIDDVVVSVDPIYSGSLTQTVTVTYDEPMNTGVNPTVTLSGSNWGSASGATWNSSTEFEVSFTHNGTSEEITSTVTVAADAQDVAGNVDQSGDNSTTFEVDTKAPTVTSITPSTDEYVGGSLPFDVDYTVVFDEPVQSLDYTLTYDGTSPTTDGGGTPTSTDGGYTWVVTLEIQTGTSDGDKVRLEVGSGTLDIAGNAYAGSDVSGYYILDVTPPEATITRDDYTPTNAGTISWSVDWTEEVTNFSDAGGDVNPTFATSGTVSYTGWSVTTSDNINYTVTVTGVTGDGDIDISVAAGVDDLFGNTSTASYNNVETYTIDNTLPYISSSIPNYGDDPVNPFQDIEITFSEELFDGIQIAGTTLDGTSDETVFTIEYSPLSGGGPFTLSTSEYDASWSVSGSNIVLTIDPTPGSSVYFPDDADIELVFGDDELYDAAGNELDRTDDEDYKLEFTTADVPPAPINFEVDYKLQTLVRYTWVRGDAQTNTIIAMTQGDDNTDFAFDELNDLDAQTQPISLSYGTPTSEIGTGTSDYAVYKGAATQIVVTGLTRDTWYAARAYGYDAVDYTLNPIEAEVQFRTFAKENNYEVVAGVQGLTIGNLYPNPVSTELNFNFEIMDNSNVKVEIVNNLGAVIATPVNNVAYSYGVHNVTIPIQSNNISSGTYFLRVSANGQTLTRPFTVIR